MKCKTFEYGSEELDTGIAAIDAIETDNSLDQLAYQMTLEQTGTFNENVSLEDGTLLMQEDGSTGAGLGDNIISEDETHGGYIQAENAVQGAVASYIIQETYKVDTIDENAMNDFFDTAEDSILDFSESNPFGDAGKL